MAIGTPVSLGTFAPVVDAPNNFDTTAVTPSDAKIIVVAGMMSSGATIPTQTVSGGGLSWTKDHEVTGTGGGFGMAIAVHSAHAPSGLASATTLTLNTTPATFGATIGACYVTGLADTSFVDVFDGQFRTDATTSWDTTATITTNADDLVIGGAFIDWGSTTSVATGGATELFDFQSTNSWTQTVTYKILSATASTSLTGTWSADATQADMSIFVAYKAEADIPWVPEEDADELIRIVSGPRLS